jgi:inosine-uridine nucleoside N-ribohydrolase
MMAIFVALAEADIDLLGVTTVAGNQVGENTYNNALKVLTLVDRSDIPVSRGCDVPLLRPLRVAPDIHGVSGLDGADLPEPGFSGTGMHAVDFLAKSLREATEPVTLVPTGPLTNIGLLFRKHPDLLSKIREIILMGGAVYESNVTPAAEFNIFVDPEAAHIVFDSGLPITMVGLDVTNRGLLDFSDIDRIAKMGGKVSSVVAPLLRFFASAYEEHFGIPGAPLHDALAMSLVAHRGLVETKRLRVDVETTGELTRGRTVTDVHHVTGKEPNADVALEVDVDRFKEIIFETMGAMDNS